MIGQDSLLTPGGGGMLSLYNLSSILSKKGGDCAGMGLSRVEKVQALLRLFSYRRHLRHHHLQQGLACSVNKGGLACAKNGTLNRNFLSR